MDTENQGERGGARERRHRPFRKGLVRRLVIGIREVLLGTRLWVLRRALSMDLHPTCKISWKANLDLTNPKGIHVGEETYVAFGACILTHDMTRLVHADTKIGKRCFIGAHSIILPGIRIGDHCIVAAGSVVTKDVPSNCICAGNPARVIREGVQTVKWGILKEDYERAVQEAKQG